MDSAITFTELLLYNERETKRWKEWFASRPEALEIPFPIANASNVRGLLAHIFAVELLFANAVSNGPRPGSQELQARAADDLFGLSEDAFKKFQEFIRSAQPEDWDEVKDVGFAGCSRRPCCTVCIIAPSLRLICVRTDLPRCGRMTSSLPI